MELLWKIKNRKRIMLLFYASTFPSCSDLLIKRALTRLLAFDLLSIDGSYHKDINKRGKYYLPIVK
jgi:hypothetical protein